MEHPKKVASQQTDHDNHCFIVMPFGRDAPEQKWFKGWYEVVIAPAVRDAGYEPILSAKEEQPGAINDEIRTHLAVDPMVVVDLGGAEPENQPNPNVMYELGIRHALSLPLVMMAWKGQRLPFDVGNQRMIVEDRDFVDIETNRHRLVAFLQAAKQGKFYRPMEAVQRGVTIAAATQNLGEDSLLLALTQEIKDLKTLVAHPRPHRAEPAKHAAPETLKRITKGKVFSKDLYPYFLSIGGTNDGWIQITRQVFSTAELAEMRDWGFEEWKEHISAKWLEIRDSGSTPTERPSVPVTEELLAQVKELLPQQPWPQGVHREICEKLNVSTKVVYKAIAKLISRGDFMQQVNGVLIRDALPSTEDGTV